MPQNPDIDYLNSLFSKALESGEIKTQRDARKWLRDRGFDERGKAVDASGRLGVLGESMASGFGFALGGPFRERVVTPFSESAGQNIRKNYEKDLQASADRVALGTAPEARLERIGGTLAGGLAGEMTKGAGIAAAARMLGASSALPATIGIAGLQALEEVGSKPEESLAGLSSDAAKWLATREGTAASQIPGMQGAMQEISGLLGRASQSSLGRGLIGAALSIPDFIGAGSLTRAARARGARAAAEAAAEAATSTPSGPLPGLRRTSFPEGFSPTETQQALLSTPRGGAIDNARIDEAFPEARSALERLSEYFGSRQKGPDPEILLREIQKSFPKGGAGPSLPTRRIPRSEEIRRATRAREREAAARVAQFQRNLTGAAAAGFRSELGRAAVRTMEGIEATQEAQKIAARRASALENAATTQQRSALERMHAAEDARLAGTPLGDALKKIALPAAAIGGVGAASQMGQQDGEPMREGMPIAAAAAAFLGVRNPSVWRTVGRVVDPSNLGFLDKAYSRLETGVVNARQNTMSGAQWLNTLKNSAVSQSEIEWTGLGRYLSDNADSPVSKDNIGDFLDGNRLQIEEHVLVPEYAEAAGEKTFGFFDYGRPPAGSIDATTKFKNRSNYREVVFTFEPKVKATFYEGPHYNGENVFAHIRMFDVDSPRGKTLVVEEIQSDLHQSARKRGGYESPEESALRLEKARAWRPDAFPTEEARRARIAEINKALEAFPKERRPIVAPFSKTEEWTELGLKKALDEAVSGGYDQLVITNWPQATRANLRSTVFDDVIGLRITPEDGGVASVTPIRKGRKVGDAVAVPVDQISKFVDDPDVIRQFNDAVAGGPAALADDVVEVMSDRAFTFGDKRLRLYYDEKIPSVLRKYLGSIGVKAEIEKVNLPVSPAVRGAAKTQPNIAIRITPEIKTKISAGQRFLAPALIAGGTAAAAGAADAAERDRERQERNPNALPQSLPDEPAEAGLGSLLVGLAVGGAAVRGILAARRATAAISGTARLSMSDAIAAADAVKAAAQQNPRIARAIDRVARPVGPRAGYGMPMRTMDEVIESAKLFASNASTAQDIERVALENYTRLNQSGRISWQMEREAAAKIGLKTQDLATRDPSRQLSVPEMLALTDRIGETITRRNVFAALARDNDIPAELKNLFLSAAQAIDEDAMVAINRLVRDKSEYGRSLNALKIAKATSLDPADWLERAQKLAGGKPLNSQDSAALQKLIGEGDFIGAQKQLSQIRAANMSRFDKLSSFMRTAMLSRLGRVARDIQTNATHAASRAAMYSVAPVIEDLLIGLGVYNRRVFAGNAKQNIRAMYEGAKKGVMQAVELFRGGARTPEQFERLTQAAARYNFSEEASFTNPMLRAWEAMVKRSIAVVDQPFYEATLRMAFESLERAIGASKGLTGDALEAHVKNAFNKPSPESLRIAAEEASQAVFQQGTVLDAFSFKPKGTKGAETAAAAGRFVGTNIMPFSKTVTAITETGAGMTPLGVLDMAFRVDKSQRAQILRLSKMAVGTGWALAGAILEDKGLINLGYPDDPNERERWKQEGRIEDSILVRGAKWVGLATILGPEIIPLLMGAYARRYMQEDAEGTMEAVVKGTAAAGRRAISMSPGYGATQRLGQAYDMLSEDPDVRKAAMGEFAKAQAGMYIPAPIRDIAAMGDVDESGNIISRHASGEDLTSAIVDALKYSTPGLRQTLPANVKPFGELVTGGPGGLTSLVNPFRMSTATQTPLTEALEEIGYFPGRRTSAGRDAAEQAAYMQEYGPREREFLEKLIGGDPETQLRYITSDALREFRETGDRERLLQRALANFRSRMTEREKKGM